MTISFYFRLKYGGKKGKKGSIIASTIMSVGLEGMKGHRVLVEANVRSEKDQFVIVGLPDASIKKSKERILSSIHALDVDISMKKITLHLLIRSPEAPLGKVMSHINKRYSEYYKKKYQYSGYLYGSRYFAECTRDPIGILAVSRYIHRNPIATTIPMVERMEDYPYSSYAFYARNSSSPYPFLYLELLPTLLSPGYGHSTEGYCRYCEEVEGRNLLEIPKLIQALDYV